MIVTIHWLDIDTTHLTWSQQQLVRYLRELRERRGDVLLFSPRRASVVTGMEREDVNEALHAMAEARAIELDAA